MKQTVEFKDWTPDAETRGLVQAEIRRLQRLIRTVPGGITSGDVTTQSALERGKREMRTRQLALVFPVASINR